jgi:hypothetical protein
MQAPGVLSDGWHRQANGMMASLGKRRANKMKAIKYKLQAAAYGGEAGQ